VRHTRIGLIGLTGLLVGLLPATARTPQASSPEPATRVDAVSAPEAMTPSETTPAPAPAIEAAARPAPAAAASVSTPEPAPVTGTAGMIATIDPETGRLGRPDAARRAAITRASAGSPFGVPDLDRSDIGLQVVRLPDGTEMVNLQGRFQEHVVARVGPSGRIETDCVQGQDVVKRLAGDAAVREER